jgi:hypothetical protein
VSAIDDIISFPFRCYSLLLLSMPIGIDCRRSLYVILEVKQKIPFANTGEYQCSMIEVFRVIPFHLLISSDPEYLSTLGEVFWLLIPYLSANSFTP